MGGNDGTVNGRAMTMELPSQREGPEPAAPQRPALPQCTTPSRHSREGEKPEASLYAGSFAVNGRDDVKDELDSRLHGDDGAFFP